MDRELQLILKLLNPFPTSSEIEKKEALALDQQRLILILMKNKIFTHFSRRLSDQSSIGDFLIDEYPLFRKMVEETNNNQKVLIEKFLATSRRLSIENVNLLLIKSAGDFPFESSNFDCLIESDKLFVCNKILREEGYQELRLAREPHKFLYRKVSAPRELPLHIHTKVEWEAEVFANEVSLYSRAIPFMNLDTGALIPSVEDSMLITIAHYFFEDHEIKLRDLLNICNLSRKLGKDWNYIFNQAKELGWTDSLALNLELLNQMSFNCFGSQLFQDANKFRKMNGVPSKLAHKTVSIDAFGKWNIPYGISALFFLRKILNMSSYSFCKKTQRLDYVLSDILRRRVVGYIEP